MADPPFAPATPEYQAIVDHALTTTRGIRQRLDFDRDVDDRVILDCIDVASRGCSMSWSSAATNRRGTTSTGASGRRWANRL